MNLDRYESTRTCPDLRDRAHDAVIYNLIRKSINVNNMKRTNV